MEKQTKRDDGKRTAETRLRGFRKAVASGGDCIQLVMVTQDYHAQIYVTLRPSVLDPAGTAVQAGLKHLGYENVERVRIGKYIEVSLKADSPEVAREQLDKICDQLLANPVIENYRIDLLEMSTPMNRSS